MSATAKNFEFTTSQSGIRLDKYVSESCPGLSRTQAKHLIENGHVRVNGDVEKSSSKLNNGDVINVSIPPLIPTDLVPEDIPVPIIYEDDDILVVDKPAGLTVHPAPGHAGHTLVNAVLSHLASLAEETQRPGIVHRLDKDTSGVMVIARNAEAHHNLSDQFKKRLVYKVYLALVKGNLTPQEGIIEAPVGRDTGDRKKMTVTGKSRGRQALTRYKVVRYIGKHTLLEAMPQTGRTHQIRVHLAAIGYPVVGDSTYGIQLPFLSRQFLHAYKLGFYLPSTGEYVEFTSPMPEDLENALKKLS